jgi:hypothetical protein
MDNNLCTWIDIGFKCITSLGIIIALFQLREVRERRMIDVCWKIGDLYSSSDQRLATENIRIIREEFLQGTKVEVADLDEWADKYNTEYHLARDKNKAIDTSILHRLRLLNQAGFLLNKRLINEDMLFGIIGVSLGNQYHILQMVSAAHRKEHNAPHLYSYVELTWLRYNEWKVRTNL